MVRKSENWKWGFVPANTRISMISPKKKKKSSENKGVLLVSTYYKQSIEQTFNIVPI